MSDTKEDDVLVGDNRLLSSTIVGDNRLLSSTIVGDNRLLSSTIVGDNDSDDNSNDNDSDDNMIDDLEVLGEYKDAAIPRSKMFISKELKEEDKTNIKSLVFGNEHTKDHFYLIMNPDKLYTTEMVNQCQGRVCCFYCHRPIPQQIYFYPLEFIGGKSFRVSPLPHCRKECAFAVVISLRSELLSALFPQMWGLTNAAPPREMLWLGVTIEEFHKMCDRNQVCEYSETSKIRALLSPVYITSTLFKNHQLVPDVVKLMSDMEAEEREALGPNGTEDALQDNIVTLSARKIINSEPAKVFSLDPSTFRHLPPSQL